MIIDNDRLLVIESDLAARTCRNHCESCRSIIADLIETVRELRAAQQAAQPDREWECT